jgi:hypothetical protein
LHRSSNDCANGFSSLGRKDGGFRGRIIPQMSPSPEGETGGGCLPSSAARTTCLRKAGSLRGIKGEAVPLAEGDTGGGKIIYTSLHSGKLVDCCCSTDFSFNCRTPRPPAFRCLSATERVPIEEGGQSDERRLNFCSTVRGSTFGRACCRTYRCDIHQEEYFHVPLPEGDIGGGCCPPVRRTHNVLAEGGLFEGDKGGGTTFSDLRALSG